MAPENVPRFPDTRVLYWPVRFPRYTRMTRDILTGVVKRLVDIDDDALRAAQAELGTETIKDTVNEALRLAAKDRPERVRKALEMIASVDFIDRDELWR